MPADEDALRVVLASDDGTHKFAGRSRCSSLDIERVGGKRARDAGSRGAFHAAEWLPAFRCLVGRRASFHCLIMGMCPIGSGDAEMAKKVKRDRAMDTMLRKDHKRYEEEAKLLLLGPGESGKSMSASTNNNAHYSHARRYHL